MSDATDPFAAVRARYRKRLAEEAVALDQLIHASPPDVREQIGNIAHRLAGSSGTFGFTEISAAARSVALDMNAPGAREASPAALAAPLVKALTQCNDQ